MGIDIAVCDSDMEIANDIKHLIALHQPEARVEIFLSADELRGHEDFFDIYFLDIKGISGLEIARDIREKQKRTGGIKSIIMVSSLTMTAVCALGAYPKQMIAQGAISRL